MVMYFIRNFIIKYFVKIWEFIFGRKPERLPEDSIVDGIKDNLELEGIVIHKGAWDKFVDGLNRLPRPIGTFGVYALIGTAIFSPETYMNVMVSLAATPDMMFVVYLTIIGFWFGGKLIQQSKTSKLIDSMKSLKRKENNASSSDEKTKTEEKKKEINGFEDPE